MYQDTVFLMLNFEKIQKIWSVKVRSIAIYKNQRISVKIEKMRSIDMINLI